MKAVRLLVEAQITVCRNGLALLPLIAQMCLGRRWLRGTALIPAKEFVLNLHRDLMQPSLGSIRPVRVLADFCLKLSYPVFSTSKLSG
jgi:hypothetical protein